MMMLSAMALVGVLLSASPEPAAALANGEKLLTRSKFNEAHAAFQSVVDNLKAPASLRAEAEVRLGCMALEFEGQPPEAARTRFARALQLFPKVAAPVDWNPTCRDILASVKSEQKPAPVLAPVPAPAPRPPPRPVDVVDRAQLERERQERIRLQEKLNALSAEIEAAKKKSEPGSAIDPATRDHVASLEESITTLRAELKERDDRLLAMSLKVDRPPAVQKPFTRRLTVPTIVLGALAVGAVGTGVGFGVDARNNKMRFMSTPYPAPAAGYARNGTRSQIVADSCFGGAIALAATALLVFVFQGPPEEPSP